MKTKIVAYLQVYNDWEFLSESLLSIRDFVDEIVVVDGCYQWLSLYYESRGFNPCKSQEIVYDKISDSKIPFKTIGRVWDNQIQKRMAGYEQSDADYVVRFDSDEILTLDEKLVDDFLKGSCSVAGMNMPTYLADDLVVLNNHFQLPTQNFIFKKSRISARDHLEYMWLVLTKDVIGGSYQPVNIFPQPIAYNMHMTAMRSLETSTNRAAYYFTNWMRKNGFPFLPSFNIPPHDDIDFLKNFFDFFGVDNFYKFLITDKVSLSMDDLLENSNISKVDNYIAKKYFDRYIHSFFDFYTSQKYFLFLSKKELFFDLTNSRVRTYYIIDNKLSVQCDCEISDISAYLILLNDDSSVSRIYLQTVFMGSDFTVDMTPIDINLVKSSKRIILSLTICVDDTLLHFFSIKT